MGNGAVSQDGSVGSDYLDQQIAKERQTKPAPKSQDVPTGSGKQTSSESSEFSNIQSNGDTDVVKVKEKEKGVAEGGRDTEAAAAASEGSAKKSTPKEERKNSKDQVKRKEHPIKPIKESKKHYEDGTEDYSEHSSGSESDVEPVDVLLQFIPYYGQGDPANDSIVRSTLSSLSVEDIDSQDEYGNTLLLLACQYRCEDLVRIMLNKGADANAVNTSGACCLHFACYRESASIGVAKILLKNGANPDVAESTFGCTPLHYCAGTGDINFCKLLLSYGAQINALDYYNYTCVDYATEAGMVEVAEFLQKKLMAASASGFGITSGKLSSPSSKPGGGSSSGVSNADISNWESHVDPDSNGKYYIHIKTGECLWEHELKLRIQQYQLQQSRDSGDHDGGSGDGIRVRGTGGAGGLGSTGSMKNVNAAGGGDGIAAAAAGPKISEADLIKQATQARLVVFFTTHDPARLLEVDALTEQYKGKEHELLNELCVKYKVDGGPELKAFQEKLQELRPTGNNNSGANRRSSTAYNGDGFVSDPSLVDPLLLQEMAVEERKRFEAQLEEEISALRRKFETQMDEEKATFRQSISEKEGLIAKLKSEIDSLSRGKDSKEVRQLFSAFNTIFYVLFVVSACKIYLPVSLYQRWCCIVFSCVLLH
jgi:hypothetical protein